MTVLVSICLICVLLVGWWVQSFSADRPAMHAALAAEQVEDATPAPFEQPHDHRGETEDPTPPGTHVERVQSTGADAALFPSWQGNSQDVANGLVRRRSTAAFYMTGSSMSPALLDFASRQGSTSTSTAG